MIDLFEFWSRMGPTDKVHPADQAVFDRLKGQHGFDLKCLPLNFTGPLKTAPVVLLYLSPGLSAEDYRDAKTKRGQLHYAEQRTGTANLSGDAASAGHRWRTSRLAFLGDWQSARDRIAVMDIGAYHSKDFVDHDILASLPSSRIALDWAQSVLFPEAEAGKRVVICMRTAKYWGLRTGQRYGKSLFAPETGRSGHMSKGPLRETITRMARAKLFP